MFASIFIQIWHSIPDPIWIFLKWKLFGRRFYCPDANPLLLVPVTGLKKHIDFTINLETILSKLPADSEVIVLGDMNMCALRKDNVYKTYANMLRLDGFKQLIHTPTRVTPTSKSSLDHIICNYDDKISQYGVITNGVSDHFFTYCTRKSTKVIYNKHKCVNVRSLKNYSKEFFTDKLSDIGWSEVTLSDDVNKAWSTFTCLLMDTVNSVAPLKEVRIKQRSE